MRQWSLLVVTVGMLCLSVDAGFCQVVDGDFAAVSTAAARAREQGDPTQAVTLYTRALALKPNWPEGWWSLGTLDYGADQYAEAQDALTHFIALTPNAGPALALRGLCEFSLAQYADSLKDLQQGIAAGAASQPRNAQIILYHEALLLTRTGQFEQALAKYMVFVKQSEVQPELATAVGLAALRMPLLPPEVDAAQADLVTAVGQSAIGVMMGDKEGSAQAWQQIFARSPSTPYLHYSYGYLLFTSDPDAAAAQFQQELMVNPDSALAHAMLAWAANLQGNFSAALPNAAKAAEEDPSLAMGQLMYGRALVETGDLTDGVAHLDEVLKQEPGNLEAHLTMAKAYSKLGRSEEARRERLLCLTLSQQGPGARATP